MKKIQRIHYSLLLVFLLLSCEGEVGPSGIDSLVEITNEPAGSNCAAGGLKVVNGQDANRNGVLDAGEIKSTKYVCGGTAGQNSLIKTTAEVAGVNCSTGGIKIEAGVDANDNATLEQSEVLSTQFVCNGTNGANGTNGTNSLVTSSTVAPGSECPNGGVKISVGVDANTNGLLEQSEIESTQVICKGPDGTNSLVVSSPVAPGTECPYGGISVEVGVDTDRNGLLEDSEVQATQFVCNGATGLNSLIWTSPVTAGPECINGGIKIDAGFDSDGSGTLEQSEVQSTQFLCNGLPGLNSLVSTSVIEPGPDCANGGISINVGMDADNSGTLEPGEVQSAQVVCSGPDGIKSLITSSPVAAGADCANGGIKIEVGIDTDRDGLLSQSEVQSMQFVCNGATGTSVLVSSSPVDPGPDCSNGGLRIDIGIDTDRNGLLDQSEVTSSQFACNGVNGINSLLNSSIVDPGSDCVNGGIKIDIGADNDGNGLLEEGEILSTSFVCNGSDANKELQIRLLLAAYGGNANGTSSLTGDLFGTVIKFNKSDYQGVNSILFSPKVFTSNATHPAYVELFNVTDGVVIANSTLSPGVSATQIVNAEILLSGNILDSLPETEITLSIRLRSSNAGTDIYLTGESYLIMLRN